MRLVRIVPLLVAGLLMAACSDGEIEAVESDTAVETVEETTSPPPAPPAGDFPYDMSRGFPHKLDELMHDHCYAAYLADLDAQGVDYGRPFDQGSTRYTHDVGDRGLAVFHGSFSGDATYYDWECRIWYDLDTGEWDSLDVKEFDKDAAARPGDDAVELCHRGVESKLVSPASAEFSEPLTRKQDDGSWTISGYVDSMNRMGAPLRSQWSCQVEYDLFTSSWVGRGVTVTER